jgi:hypothetical protein
MDPRLTIGLPPIPKQADVDAFTVWLRGHGVNPVIAQKIVAVAIPIEDYRKTIRGGVKCSFEGAGGSDIPDRVWWTDLYVQDCGDYRLVYSVQ